MMIMEEIKRNLIKFAKMYYDETDVMYLDVNQEEVELRFHVREDDREEIKRFYENNKHIFLDETDKTRGDLKTLSDISIRVDGDGIFFGKSSFDLLATNVVAFYLLEKYLNGLMEELPRKLREYKDQQISQ